MKIGCSKFFKETQKLTKRYIKNLTLWNLMGSSAAQLGYLGEAINAFQHAISIKPDFAEAHNNMGNALQAHGRLQEAIDAFKKAVSTKPNYAEAYYNMGNALLAHGSLDEAVDAFKKAISTKPGYAEAYNNLGNALKEQEKLDEAIDAFKKAISVKPDYVEAEMNLAAIKRLAVPDWHIPMMNEDFRNNAYQKAIKSAVQDRDVVLDIGTGAGLLSMIAADCGAKEVISCEVSPTISKIADKIIQKNGFADKIKLINKTQKYQTWTRY